MNVFVVLSILLSIGVFFTGLYLSSPELTMFFDTTSLFIVGGGSFTATAIAFKLNKLTPLIKVFFRRLVFGSDIELNKTVTELILAVDSIKKGKTPKEVADECSDLFMKEALLLIQDGLVEPSEIIGVLELRNQKQAITYKSETNKLKSIGKYPPAFGMIGTTIGMIVLLANLGGEDAMKKIGPAMGVCLITTLYGAAMANIFILPMADNLNESGKELYSKNEIIIEGIRLVLEKKSPILAAERLNSYLLYSQRVEWKEVLTGR